MIYSYYGNMYHFSMIWMTMKFWRLGMCWELGILPIPKKNEGIFLTKDMYLATEPTVIEADFPDNNRVMKY